MKPRTKKLLTIIIILLTGGLFLFVMLYKKTKGFKNNPFGIEYRKENEWHGAIRPHNGNRFESFISNVYAVRAARIILLNYKKVGVQTIEAIINKWAPPVENNTRDYVAFVEYQTGIQGNKIIDVSNDAIMFPLLKAMAKFESGYNLTESEFIKSQNL